MEESKSIFNNKPENSKMYERMQAAHDDYVKYQDEMKENGLHSVLSFKEFCSAAGYFRY